MVDIGITKPNNKIVAYGTPAMETEANVETATNMYPGRLVKAGSTAYDVVVCTAADLNPGGWLGYETCNPNYKKAAPTTIYEASDKVPIIRGGHFVIVAKLATSQTILKGDALVAAADGMVAKKDDAEATHDFPIVGYAEEAVTTTSSAADILVRSVI